MQPAYRAVFSDGIGEILAEHRFALLLTGISSVLFVLSVMLLIQSTRMEVPIEFTEASASAAMPVYAVDIQGAVSLPGIYRIREDERVDDVIRMAGGLSKNADTEFLARSLNRAARLSDGAKIYVPARGEGEQGNTSHNNCFTTNNEINARNTGFSGQSVLSQNDTVSSLVSVNTASSSELESLNGVGPVTAEKIIRNRPYTALTQLVERKSLSQSLFEKLAGQLSL